MRHEFPFILIGKSTIAFFTGQSRSVIKSCYTGGGPEQGFWCCFTDELNQSLVSSAAQAMDLCAAGVGREPWRNAWRVRVWLFHFLTGTSYSRFLAADLRSSPTGPMVTVSSVIASNCAPRLFLLALSVHPSAQRESLSALRQASTLQCR